MRLLKKQQEEKNKQIEKKQTLEIQLNNQLDKLEAKKISEIKNYKRRISGNERIIRRISIRRTSFFTGRII